MPLISCQNATLSYESNVVCNNLNFTVLDGDYLCIVGENGSGKSTLVKALLGLKDCSEGKIVLKDGFTRADIGYLPQITQIESDFPANVFEVVLSGCIMGSKTPFFKASQKALAEKNMEQLGILSLKKKSYRNLSGGQKQRVLLARALCAAKRVLVLDEPASGLDPKATAKMYDIIKTLNRDLKITVIMVTHDTSPLLLNATHVLHINHSSSFFGTTNEYLNSTLAKNYLGGGLDESD